MKSDWKLTRADAIDVENSIVMIAFMLDKNRNELISIVNFPNADLTIVMLFFLGKQNDIWMA